MGDLNVSQATYKTGVSYEYVRTMVAYGRIPSERVLERFAEGLGADLHKLRVAAGYDEESDPIKRVEVFLSGMEQLSEFAKDEIRRVVREEVEGSN